MNIRPALKDSGPSAGAVNSEGADFEVGGRSESLNDKNDNKETLEVNAKGRPEAAGVFSWLWGLVKGLWDRVFDLPFWAREVIRKSLHIGVVILALPMRWLNWHYGLAFAGVALLWNAFGMPRYFRFTFRDEEEQAGYSKGMLSYPVSVFALMILFPLPIAVSQWATLSFGDGFATLIGRFFGKTPLPWNKDKTVAGFSAFFIMGTVGSMFFFWFTADNALASSFLWSGAGVLWHIQTMALDQIAAICVISTFAAALFESLPIPYVDDNVAAPMAGALTKLAMCFIL